MQHSLFLWLCCDSHPVVLVSTEPLWIERERVVLQRRLSEGGRLRPSSACRSWTSSAKTPPSVPSSGDHCDAATGGTKPSRMKLGEDMYLAAGSYFRTAEERATSTMKQNYAVHGTTIPCPQQSVTRRIKYKRRSTAEDGQDGTRE